MQKLKAGGAINTLKTGQIETKVNEVLIIEAI